MRVKPASEKAKLMTEIQLRDYVLNNFSKYDTSGDGCLDKYELACFFSDVLERKKLKHAHDPEELAGRFIQMIDLDGDNKLTRE